VKWLTFEIQRTPGFRFNLIDILLIGFLLTLALALFFMLSDSSIYWVPPYLGLSFFIFCNIFRIGNRLEPWWYVPFFGIAIYCLLTQDLVLFWWLVLFVLEPLKWGLIIYHVLRRPYHGAFHELINRYRDSRAAT